MISERDFVLNNYYNPIFTTCTVKETLSTLKSDYKTIIANTSEESETVKEIEHIIEFIGFGGLTDIAQMHVKRKLFDLKNKIH